MTSPHFYLLGNIAAKFLGNAIINSKKNTNNSRTGMKIFFDKNIVQDYGFLNCGNELLSLALSGRLGWFNVGS